MNVLVRNARTMDAGRVADILSAHVDQAAWLPRIFSRAEELQFADDLIARGWVCVAEIDTTVVGFCARDGAEVHALYVTPGEQNTGVGKILLDHAKAAYGRLMLWSYQCNQDASRFYRREGFVETRSTDGAGNDVGLPDMRYEWQSTQTEAAA